MGRSRREVANDENDQEAERARRQKRRSAAIALALIGLALIFYVATMLRLGGNVMNRTM